MASLPQQPENEINQENKIVAEEVHNYHKYLQHKIEERSNRWTHAKWGRNLLDAQVMYKSYTTPHLSEVLLTN